VSGLVCGVQHRGTVGRASRVARDTQPSIYLSSAWNVAPPAPADCGIPSAVASAASVGLGGVAAESSDGDAWLLASGAVGEAGSGGAEALGVVAAGWSMERLPRVEFCQIERNRFE